MIGFSLLAEKAVSPLLNLPLSKYCDDNYTDKNSLHSYLPVYETLLTEILHRKKSPIRLLEIGIQRGGSQLLWLNALPGSYITGVDIQTPMNKIVAPNYKEMIGNAYSKRFLETELLGCEYDFIVEDGSHCYNDLLFFMKYYPNHLALNGIIVIEDIPEVSWFQDLKDELPKGFSMELIDRRSIKGRWDDVLIVIRRER
jgi:hypothetical protein